MRHTPCGCAPYGEGAFHIRRARPLGVPSAKRQTVQTNEFVRIWQFLHRRAEVVSAAVRDEGALRMRRAPCGYCGCNLTHTPPKTTAPL